VTPGCSLRCAANAQSSWIYCGGRDQLALGIGANTAVYAGKSRIAGGAIVCCTPNSFPLASRFRVVPVTDLGQTPRSGR
jgi:hypothetical protein